MLNELRDFILPIDCPKTSVTNHEPSPRHIPEHRRPVSKCLFLCAILSLFRSSLLCFCFFLRLSNFFVFLNDTLLKIIGFETFLHDAPLTVLLVMKDASYSDRFLNSDYTTTILLESRPACLLLV